MARPILLALLTASFLSACTSAPKNEPDQVVDRLIAEDAARAAAAQPLEDTYPSLQEVPPRPKLGYSVAQRRQIQSGFRIHVTAKPDKGS